MIKKIVDGILQIDGCSAVELAKKYGTPLYVVSENAIMERINELKDDFLDKYPNVRAAYAAKAFCTMAMCRLCEREGIGLDVVSGGELYTAIKAGYPPKSIEFNGNNKLASEIEMAIDYGVGRIIVDGLQELSLIEETCKRMGKRTKVLFRITPGVKANSHGYLITGKKDSKFGIPLTEDVIYPQIENAIDSEYVDFMGFHFHIGSQIFESEAYLEALTVVLDIVAEVKGRFDFDIKELNIGGGFGVTYTDEKRMPYSYYLGPLLNEIESFFKKLGYDRPAIVIEPGRSIVAEAGLSLYTIGSIKDIKGIRKYISVDGGMNDNIRPALYNAKYDGLIANRADVPKTDAVTVAGKCCESGDILIHDLSVAENVQAGDLLAVFSTGAYGYSMASNYNRNPIPPVVLIKNGCSELIVKGQTYDHIISNDVIPDSLR
ncbi:MAG TPA: diaminopimelate decarboxylase [Anaerovoracaceae bacterium]|nr:diaminopimelate decarboxylase [Anaerovoracaceae bacterium]